MRKSPLFFLMFLFSSASAREICNCPAQRGEGKGTFYFSWGYNKDYFSKNNLHFYDKGAGNYDFTLYNVKAKDRPEFYKITKYALAGDLSVSQYSYRIGYFFNDKRDLGVEINFDHTKYVMMQNQTVRIKGAIHDVYYDKDTLINASFLRFEHTNGANFLMTNLTKRKSFFCSENNRHRLSAIIKPGTGIVIPKTDVAVFNEPRDNRFHIAGWIAGLETGIRYDAWKIFFIEPSVKGTFADYMDVLTVGSGKADHRFWCFEILLTAGFQFGL